MKTWYHNESKYVDGVKIPQRQRTTHEFREKWKAYYKNLSKQKCEFELSKLLNLSDHKGHGSMTSSFSLEDRFKIMLLKEILSPVKVYKEKK